MMKRTIPIVLSAMMMLMLLSACSTEQTMSKETVSTMEKGGKVVEETAEATEENANAGIDLDFKAAMDSYEAFFDEYVEFMEQYMTSDDMSGLTTAYSDYMVKYIDTMEKIEAIDENELTTEEALYYAEVTARISQKLVDVVE